MFLVYQIITLLGFLAAADAETSELRSFLHVMHGSSWVSYKVSVNQGTSEKYLVQMNEATGNLKCSKVSHSAKNNVVGVDCEKNGRWETMYCEINRQSTTKPPRLRNCRHDQDTVITYAKLDSIPSYYLNTWDFE